MIWINREKGMHGFVRLLKISEMKLWNSQGFRNFLILSIVFHAFFSYQAWCSNEPPDTKTPSTINNLVASNPTVNSIILSWSAPGDAGTAGTASMYDIRYAAVSINSGNWATAAQCSGEPAPQAAGTSQSYVVTGLTAGTTYYFAMKTANEVPIWSGVSNSPSGMTGTVSGDLRPNMNLRARVIVSPANSSTCNIVLTWNSPDGQAYDYYVYRRKEVGNAYWGTSYGYNPSMTEDSIPNSGEIYTGALTALTYTDTGITNNGSATQYGYIYWVKAVKGATTIYSWCAVAFVRPPTMWYRYDNVIERLTALAAAHPETAKLIKIGKTVKGKDIYCLRVGRITETMMKGPAIILAGVTHGGESGPEIITRQMESLLSKVDSNAALKNMVDNIQIWAIPFTNADSREYLTSGYYSYIQNNQNVYPSGASLDNKYGWTYSNRGVNLCRNYDYQWALAGEPKGPSAFSEPESQSIRDICQNADKTTGLILINDNYLYPPATIRIPR